MSEQPDSPFEGLNPPYDIILSDPPWRFKSNSQKNPGRNAIGHYDCMDLAAIKALPVADVAAKDALLFMWTTAPFAELSWDVLAAWGFKYVSQMVWVKERIGTGFWVRNRHEIIYIAKRGRFPCPRPAPFSDSVIEGQQRQHSRKPDALHEMIQGAFPGTRKLEMFAREPRDGWDTWGNQTEKFSRPKQPDPEIDDMLGVATETYDFSDFM